MSWWFAGDRQMSNNGTPELPLKASDVCERCGANSRQRYATEMKAATNSHSKTSFDTKVKHHA